MNMMNRLSCSQCHPDTKKMSFVAFLSIWQQATIICNIINFSKISGSTNHIICNIFCLNKLLQLCVTCNAGPEQKNHSSAGFPLFEILIFTKDGCDTRSWNSTLASKQPDFVSLTRSDPRKSFNLSLSQLTIFSRTAHSCSVLRRRF